MSVLINMEMPDNCGECRMPMEWCNKWIGVEDGKRSDDCPLVPATDARPVVKAKWEWNDNNGYHYCGNCKAVSPREDQDGEYIDCPKFCHNCGARMEES